MFTGTFLSEYKPVSGMQSGSDQSISSEHKALSTDEISLVVGFVTMLISLLAVVLAFYIGNRQIKLIDKQMKLGARQIDINILTSELHRAETKYYHAHNGILVLSMGAPANKMGKIYSDMLTQIEPYQTNIDVAVKKLQSAYNRYNKEAKKQI